MVDAGAGSARRADRGAGGEPRRRRRHHFDWPTQTKLLDFLLEQGLDAPFSCRQGACSACACILNSGEVKMIKNEILDQSDLDEGYVLACQSLPITDSVAIRYS